MEASAIPADPAQQSAPVLRRGFWLALTLVMALGMLLRWWDLGKQSLWFDEGYSAWVVSLPAHRIVQVIRNDVSPPLYYLVLRAWRGWFGESEAALRSLSVLAACLALPLLAHLAWRVTHRAIPTVIATLLAAFSVLQIQYAQEARSYGVASFLAVLSVYGVVRRLQGRRAWLGLSLLAAGASVYLHNMMWFYLGALNLMFMVGPGEVKWRRRLAELVLMDGVVVLFYLPWMKTLLAQREWLQGNFWAPVPSFGDLGRVLCAAGGIKWMDLAGVLGGSWFVVLLASVVFAGIAVLALVQKERPAVRWGLAFGAYGLVPILMVFAHAQVSQSFFVEKVFTASTLAMPILAALALVGRGRRVAIGLIALLLAGSLLSTWGYFRWERKENWREAVAYVNQFPRESTMVVFVGNEGELLYDYYTRRQGAFGLYATGAPQGFMEKDPQRTIQRVTKSSDTDKLAQRIKRFGPQRVLLVYSHWQYSDPEQLTQQCIGRSLNWLGKKDFYWIEVHEYGR
jgi:mannosyltransferase